MCMMALADPPPPEFTIICIDNGARTLYEGGLYPAQLNGAKYYCGTVLKCNPKSIVSIFTMSTKSNVILVPPTNDLRKLLVALEYIPCCLDGDTDVQDALAHACSTFSRGPPKMKKRLLMFIGQTINLHLRDAVLYGKELKERGVALDVFNFCLIKNSPLLPTYEKASIFRGDYHYGRPQLETLVTDTNDNGNSHIKDITNEHESSVLRALKHRLRKHLSYLEKKAAADDEKNRSAADEKTISVETPEFGLFQNEKNKSATSRKKKKKNKTKC